jgi:hypothetical protein
VTGRRLLGVASLLFSACSSGSSPGTDAAVATCGAEIPAGQACSPLRAGSAVTPSCGTGALPSGQGGTIVDGTYVLTALTYYSADTCPTFPLAETIALSGGCMQLAVGPPLTSTASGTFTVSGNSIAITTACVHIEMDGATVRQSAPVRTFTATGTTFTLFTHDTSANPVADDMAVFTRQ